MTRTVLIAGSSRGIGAAAARHEAARGSRVILHGRSDSVALKEFSGELDAPAYHCDGQDAAAVQQLVDTALADVGAIDALICTLGSVSATDALAGSTEDWIAEYRSNVLGPVNFIRAVAPSMLANGGGRIVTVSSIRGRDNLASPEVTAYSAAKAALENVTVSFAKALAPSITVNSVAPGFVLTDMSETWSDEVRKEVATNLLGRAAQPQEIAALLCFLVSDGASFITGQTVLADGGLDAR
ncbi:SDR family NAD(P)-dependent oxidoreductase [Mycolicibacterium tokaiense]|uniref:Short-chain dehydrogenase n=1 Tax=Mycolicibacterium tokaiense TaxID=39695 RepID=A0A378TDL5_9MYCO|nr:SDR family oxidoreductase [Mycolicibacterium tokaiense]BBY86603.1 3-oxoacyl-ACP reductase [Mycolicibacterium tokaiense]STZ58892.1 short-chain dehydrogenase [Mycolicibacterium tokaiense]